MNNLDPLSSSLSFPAEPSSSSLLQDEVVDDIHDHNHLVNIISTKLEGKGYPSSVEETQFVEQVLSKEIQSMSMAERDMITFDIHGIPTYSDTDPPNIEEYFGGLEEAINNVMPMEEKKVYVDAAQK